MATLGGHLGWCHPCSDLIPILMASGASADVVDSSGDVVSLRIDDGFFPAAFKSVVKRGQLITAIKVIRCYCANEWPKSCISLALATRRNSAAGHSLLQIRICAMLYWM